VHYLAHCCQPTILHCTACCAVLCKLILSLKCVLSGCTVTLRPLCSSSVTQDKRKMIVGRVLNDSKRITWHGATCSICLSHLRNIAILLLLFFSSRGGRRITSLCALWTANVSQHTIQTSGDLVVCIFTQNSLRDSVPKSFRNNDFRNFWNNIKEWLIVFWVFPRRLSIKSRRFGTLCR
jgi:hypothetical protein